MWCLAVSLLQPWFDYGKSYRNAGETTALHFATKTATAWRALAGTLATQLDAVFRRL